MLRFSLSFPFALGRVFIYFCIVSFCPLHLRGGHDTSFYFYFYFLLFICFFDSFSFFPSVNASGLLSFVCRTIRIEYDVKSFIALSTLLTVLQCSISPCRGFVTTELVSL